MRPKLFRDPIHDIIAFDLSDPVEEVLFKLICTPTFQRLRRIRQLGFASLVYHGAEHSRFAHSIGVVHIARRMLGALRPAVCDDLTRLEVLGAALLHDIGHGPFSHAIEKVTDIHHETFSSRAILDETGEVYQILARFHPEMPRRIARYFGPLDEFPTERQLFRDIVSSQLDADRQDYILRDGHATGVKIGTYDLERILAMLMSYEATDDDGQRITRLAVSFRAREAVEDYLIARFHMFKQVYLHKTVRAAEKMLEAVLRRGASLYAQGVRWEELPAKPLLLEFLSGKPLTTAQYLSIDDTDVWIMLKVWAKSDDQALANLSKGLLSRRLFKTIDLDNNDPVIVARVLDQANEVALKLGLDPESSVLVDRASDTPYEPYDPAHPRISAHIPVVERSGRVVPIENGSDIVHLLGRDAYNRVRLCVPQEIRERLDLGFPQYTTQS